MRFLFAAIVIAVVAFPIFGILRELGFPANQALAFALFAACVLGLLGIVLSLAYGDRSRQQP